MEQREYTITEPNLLLLSHSRTLALSHSRTLALFSKMCDISGLNKGELLCRLVNGGNCVPLAEFASYLNTHLLQNYEERVNRGHIDYYDGVAIKTDLRKDTVNTYLYNRDAGVGKFERVVAAMRNDLQVSTD